MKEVISKYWLISIVATLVIFGIAWWIFSLFPSSIGDWFSKPIKDCTVGEVLFIGIIIAVYSRK